MYNTTIAISAHFNFILMELVFKGFSIVAMVVAMGAALVLIGHRLPKYDILVNIRTNQPVLHLYCTCIAPTSQIS